MICQIQITISRNYRALQLHQDVEICKAHIPYVCQLFRAVNNVFQATGKSNIVAIVKNPMTSDKNETTHVSSMTSHHMNKPKNLVLKLQLPVIPQQQGDTKTRQDTTTEPDANTIINKFKH